MAPLKFEDHAKDSLDKRRIEPKPDSWHKLSKQLDKDENKSKSKTWVWLAVASSIIGLVFLGTLVFNSETSNLPERNVVENEPELEFESELEPENQIVEDIQTDSLEDNSTNQQSEGQQIVAVESKQQNKLDKESTSITKKTRNQKPETKKLIVENTKQQLDSEQPTTDNSLPKEKINQKIEEAIAQVKDKQQNNEAVTNAYIDSLLQSATTAITEQSIYKNETLKVDADALLSQVEFELERSFRDKVFDALKTGFEEVRTAVVNRNQ